ncbi:unnamed protein product [Phytophthora fragariaefolia]|uniref:Unnamed protein product n=1 Tax=Phytophthora fragariaefolia TaxID=1490495 RepID=A0A9W6U0V3_9STRA|nr:unnamed protein product [Phytophthora fragariaefolia]
MVRLAAVRKSVTAPQAAQPIVDNVFHHHGLPEAFVSDRDPRFVSHFWQHHFRLLGTRLDMSTVDPPQTDDQTERVNRVLEDMSALQDPPSGARCFHKRSLRLTMQYGVYSVLHERAAA